MIVQSAIRYKGEIYVGRRHSDVITLMSKIPNMPKPIQGEQGFVDAKRNFYDRITAGKIAIECGQIEKLNWPPRLYSEDLY